MTADPVADLRQHLIDAYCALPPGTRHRYRWVMNQRWRDDLRLLYGGYAAIPMELLGLAITVTADGGAPHLEPTETGSGPLPAGLAIDADAHTSIISGTPAPAMVDSYQPRILNSIHGSLRCAPPDGWDEPTDRWGGSTLTAAEAVAMIDEAIADWERHHG